MWQVIVIKNVWMIYFVFPAEMPVSALFIFGGGKYWVWVGKTYSSVKQASLVSVTMFQARQGLLFWRHPSEYACWIGSIVNTLCALGKETRYIWERVRGWFTLWPAGHESPLPLTKHTGAIFTPALQHTSAGRWRQRLLDSLAFRH